MLYENGNLGRKPFKSRGNRAKRGPNLNKKTAGRQTALPRLLCGGRLLRQTKVDRTSRVVAIIGEKRAVSLAMASSSPKSATVERLACALFVPEPRSRGCRLWNHVGAQRNRAASMVLARPKRAGGVHRITPGSANHQGLTNRNSRERGGCEQAMPFSDME